MNRPLRRMGAVVMVLFGLLLINVNVLQVAQTDELNARSGNSRTILAEYDRQRGPILVGDKQIARSIPTPDDQLNYLRQYAEPELYAHATGFYSFVYGPRGVEAASNRVLAGTDDRLFVGRLSRLLTGRDPQGGAVTLTLDAAAQKAATDELKGRTGAVVALDPSTGEILAMVSSPSYDPNVLSSHTSSSIIQAYKDLMEDEDDPLLNRAISQLYPPGSTFKLVTLAAALSTGRYDPTSAVPGPAELDLPQTSAGLPNQSRAQCTPGSDTTDLTTALKKSCNTTFGALGLELGAEALGEQARAFGFGTDLEIPMEVADSSFPGDANPPQTAQSAIGQFDVQTTPLQMAMVAAGIANNGVVMTPYLVSKVQAPDLETLEQTDDRELSTAVSGVVAAQIREMMVQVVSDGTGRRAQIPGIAVAGKTGTAQTGGGRAPHAWFTSFAPAGPGETARVAVAVVLENGGGTTDEISGGKLAAPIAQKVMAAVLDGDR